MSKLYASNDKYVLELISDPRYRINRYGLIETLISRQGHTTEVWRDARTIKGGYHTVSYTSSDGKRSLLRSNRIMWAMFGDTPLNPNLVVCHKNDHSLEDNIENLQLDTQSVNNIQSYQNGRAVSFGNAKITMDNVRTIRMYRNVLNLSYSELLTTFPQFVKSKGQISEIINGKVWIENEPQIQEEMNKQYIQMLHREANKLMEQK